MTYMVGCQNYGPLLDPLNAILRIQKRTISLTTIHIHVLKAWGQVELRVCLADELPSTFLANIQHKDFSRVHKGVHIWDHRSALNMAALYKTLTAAQIKNNMCVCVCVIARVGYVSLRCFGRSECSVAAMLLPAKRNRMDDACSD